MTFPRMRRWSVSRLIRWFVTAAIIAYLVSLADLGLVRDLLIRARWPLLAIAVSFVLIDRLLMAGKWYPLVAIHVPGLSIWTTCRIYLASSFAGLFIPSLGADVLRTVALGPRSQNTPAIGASVVMERLLGMMGGGLMSGLALVLAVRSSLPVHVLFPWAAISLLAPLALILIPYFAGGSSTSPLQAKLSPVVSRFPFIKRFFSAYTGYKNHPKTVVIVAFLSLVEQLLPIAAVWLVARALNTSITLNMLLVAIPLVLFAARLPVSIWGLGVTEGGLVYILGLYGIEASTAIALGVSARLIEFVGVLPGAAFWFDIVPRRNTVAS